MKFKLDENLGTRTRNIFIDRGLDVHTVRDEKLQGTNDSDLYEVCCREQRTLVTLDLDFANIVRFPPQKGAGIVVIRLGRNPSLPLLEDLVRQFLDAMDNQPLLKGQLWVVEPGRIRVRQSN